MGLSFDICALTYWRKTVVITVSVCALATGCATVEPGQYSRPELAPKSAWTSKPPETASKTIVAEWWSEFDDPFLDDLVDRAIADSIELRILAARVDAASIGVEQEITANRPSLTLGTNTNVTRTSEGTSKSYAADAQGISWEVDLWGKVRAGIRAEEAEYRATQADYRAGYLALVADVADTYFQIRQLDEQIIQQQLNNDRAQKSLAIYRSQLDEGLVAETRVLQQLAELRSGQQTLAELQRQRRRNENRLATLIGTPAGDFQVPPATLSDTVTPLDVPSGLPSDLLSRRPDIVAAEYRVLRAHELVGQARLAKLPSLNLTGQGGLASNALSNLLSGWSFGLGAALNIPIFDPSLDLQIETNTVQQQIAEDEYRATVIKAFEEVENALSDLANRAEQARIQESRVADLQVVNRTVHAQLREGLISQLALFESERSLLSARQSLSEIQHQRLKDTVVLYKAMGGGWPAEFPTAGEQS